MWHTRSRLKVSTEADVPTLHKLLDEFMVAQGSRDLLGLFQERPCTKSHAHWMHIIVPEAQMHALSQNQSDYTTLFHRMWSP